MADQLVQWRDELKQTISSLSELCQHLELNYNEVQKVCATNSDFPLRVSRPFLNKIKKKDLNDPLLKQVLPLNHELQTESLYSKDPLMELAFNPVPGLIHKYKTRALLVLGGLCAIHCRYCFRRHFPYDTQPITNANLTQIGAYLSKHPEIDEFILSGGDPLTVGISKLHSIGRLIDQNKHIKRLRIHTRLPILIPSCIDDTFLDWVHERSQKIVMVIHTNHAQEIDDETKKAMNQLTLAGVTLFNQSVLLKNVNDNHTALTELSHALFDAKVLPYYLNILDPVEGASHFHVDLSIAQNLLYDISKILPGYLVPKLVQERPGAPFKESLLPKQCNPSPRVDLISI